MAGNQLITGGSRAHNRRLGLMPSASARGLRVIFVELKP